MPPLAGIIPHIIDGNARALDFWTTSTVDDFRTHRILRTAPPAGGVTIRVCAQPTAPFPTTYESTTPQALGRKEVGHHHHGKGSGILLQHRPVPAGLADLYHMT